MNRLIELSNVYHTESIYRWKRPVNPVFIQTPISLNFSVSKLKPARNRVPNFLRTSGAYSGLSQRKNRMKNMRRPTTITRTGPEFIGVSCTLVVLVGSVVVVVEFVSVVDVLAVVVDVMTNHLVMGYPLLQVAVTVRLSPITADTSNVSSMPQSAD